MILEEIPLLPGESDQTADVVIAEIPYTIRVQWNNRFNYWTLSIYERGGETAVLIGIKLIIDFPLTRRFRAFPWDGDLLFMHRGGKNYRPRFEDLGGSTYGLYYFDPQEKKALPVPIFPRV